MIGRGVWGDDFSAAVWARTFDAGEFAGDGETGIALGTKESDRIGGRSSGRHGFNNLMDFP